jgi:hypothetical protein
MRPPAYVGTAADGAAMTTFDDREKAFETKFAHDNELQFRVQARRDKLLGLWAAEKLGHQGEAADAYAKSVVIADMAHPGDEDVIAKIAGDLASLGIGEAEVRAELVLKQAEALRQVMASEPS